MRYSSEACHSITVSIGGVLPNLWRLRGLFIGRPPSIHWLANWLLPGLLLSAQSVFIGVARAEAPPPQEFWNYLVEFGDAQGELFDPTDYAAIADIPAQSLQPESRSERAHGDAPEPVAPVTQEQLP